ncbi:MAG: RmlC-like cupin [Lasallia pustulata]|uniref:CENP-C homolog n=1 Tax=Lasallia pustulata TaxID=136370 RepID=A0A5M8PLY1_9LECA|nr:MAG: RmlC-like cupin [Lasallia pustulata]
MKPSRTPRRNGRLDDYSNIGVAGRKTGVTLKDTGIRDEHGLEPIDGIFSSPEKSPPKRNGATENATIIEEEDMDIGQSTIPEPTEVLTAHHTRSSRTTLLIPRARSPIKTTLNSSPRRSVGPMPSPMRPSNGTPSRAMSQPLVNRRLESPVKDARPSIERSPQKGWRLPSSSVTRATNKLGPLFGRGKKRPFDLRAEVDEDQEGEEETTTYDTSALDVSNKLDTESNMLDNGDESFQVDQDDALGTMTNDETQQNPPSLNEAEEITEQQKHGRKEKGLSGKLLSTKTASVEPEFRQVTTSFVKRGRGRPSKAAPINSDTSRLPVSKTKPRQGRPATIAKQEVFQNGETEEAEASQKPVKRARHTSVDATPQVKRKISKPPPSQRNPNARVVSARKLDEKAATAEPMGPPRLPGRPKARSLFVLRSETPADDSGARVLRSGRTSVKPMAFWRNERIVYGDRTNDGPTMVLPGIKEVIRTEEIEQPKPKRLTGRRPGASKKRQLAGVEEEDEDQEPWEVEEVPIMRGEVLQWDPIIGKGNEDLTEESELAYAAGAIQTREVAGSKFRYAKTLTLPFFGSGMVDLPPRGIKRLKNSRKMQMVFFVFYGRVMVKVGDTNFSIGKGGMWQVPRGNFYSIANPYEKLARIFFAQGCEVLVESGADETDDSR